jgi:hypothetical protein
MTYGELQTIKRQAEEYHKSSPHHRKKGIEYYQETVSIWRSPTHEEKQTTLIKKDHTLATRESSCDNIERFEHQKTIGTETKNKKDPNSEIYKINIQLCDIRRKTIQALKKIQIASQ